MKNKKRRANRRPLILIGAGIALMLGAMLIWMFDTLKGEPQDGAFAGPTPAVERIARISVAEAKNAFDRGQAVFLDVRYASDHAVSRIPGAVSIPEDELPARIAELNRYDWIITYCT